MTLKKIEEVVNPIVYVFMTLILSSITYGIFTNFKKLTIFVVCFFFICIFYYCGTKFTFVLMIFFTIGIMFNYSYYNISFESRNDVRVLKNTSYEVLGSYKGKKIILKNLKDNVNVGQCIYVNGKFKMNTIKERGIVGTLYINKSKKSSGDFISKLYYLKNKIYKMLEDNIGKRKAGLISSIAFGYSEYLDEDDKIDMKNFGIIHAISVSGLHVAIVYGVLKRFLGVRFALIFSIIYVLFTGSNYSSIRAFIMLTIIEISHLVKKNNNSLSALSISGIILLLIKPYAVFEISFQLSYLATLGIILYNKKLNYKFYKLPRVLRNTVSISLSAQIFTFPYLVLVFNEVSINFILGNLLLMPFINGIVVLGNILPLTYIIPSVFDFFSYINLLIIKCLDWSLDKIEYYSLPIINCNKYTAILYMSILISVYFIKNNRKKFIYFPVVFIIFIAIELYSPIPKIQYYKEGAFLIANKGERVLLIHGKNIDINKLKNISNATKVYRNDGTICIGNKIKLNKYKNNYTLKVNNKNYILKTNKGKVKSKDYDIINFSDNNINEIIIFKDKVLF